MQKVVYFESIKKPLGKQTSRVMAWNKYHHVGVHKPKCVI